MAETIKPQNSILDVGGLRVGQAHDAWVKTGVTVILPDAPARCSVDVRGGGPGTRETDALAEGHLIDAVHAVVLAGGSVYGLDAASGVTAWLGARRNGYHVGAPPIPVSPIVPSAILFDNANDGNKDWDMTPPFRDLGIAACEAATQDAMDTGKAGAGYGATAGLYAGGIGTASEQVGDMRVGAVIAANPIGSPFMPGTDCFWAWPYEQDGEFGDVQPPQNYSYAPPRDTKLEFLAHAGASTVIGVIATNADLSQSQLKRLAIMAQDGIAMAVQPAHTPMDGDTIFALSTGEVSVPEPTPRGLSWLGAAAARCVARALTRGVYQAQQDA